uniref:ATP synthase epsilon chain, chloroplastic n=1 Tax=Koliella corcontica TaxID=155904 RepID=A0A097KMQ2_9CHLO|nr:CF1 epsilon subunit of ATP synthase [Koliella corcontica]AIT94466.1 CF1 epsilon subunit of ATP synthase [Koliella corcontica]
MSLQVYVLTPKNIVFNGNVEEVKLPSNSGRMGVLPNHISTITALEVGVMSIRESNLWKHFAVMGGFALVKRNKVTGLVNEAESADSIDSQEAEEIFIKASKQLEEAIGLKQRAEANFTYKRAKARYLAVNPDFMF